MVPLTAEGNTLLKPFAFRRDIFLGFVVFTKSSSRKRKRNNRKTPHSYFLLPPPDGAFLRKPNVLGSSASSSLKEAIISHPTPCFSVSVIVSVSDREFRLRLLSHGMDVMDDRKLNLFFLYLNLFLLYGLNFITKK